MPFTADNGKVISEIGQWHRARNQQRNWETLQQLLSLRTFPEITMYPHVVRVDGKKTWQFEFELESIDVLSTGEEPFDLLESDCKDVPMLLDLDEKACKNNFLQPGDNIWFELVDDK